MLTSYKCYDFSTMLMDIITQFKGVELTFLKPQPDHFEFLETDLSLSVCHDHLQKFSDHPFQTSAVQRCSIESSRTLVDGQDVKRVYEMIVDISVRI